MNDKIKFLYDRDLHGQGIYLKLSEFHSLENFKNELKAEKQKRFGRKRVSNFISHITYDLSDIENLDDIDKYIKIINDVFSEYNFKRIIHKFMFNNNSYIIFKFLDFDKRVEGNGFDTIIYKNKFDNLIQKYKSLMLILLNNKIFNKYISELKSIEIFDPSGTYIYNIKQYAEHDFFGIFTKLHRENIDILKNLLNRVKKKPYIITAFLNNINSNFLKENKIISFGIHNPHEYPNELNFMISFEPEKYDKNIISNFIIDIHNNKLKDIISEVSNSKDITNINYNFIIDRMYESKPENLDYLFNLFIDTVSDLYDDVKKINISNITINPYNHNYGFLTFKNTIKKKINNNVIEDDIIYTHDDMNIIVKLPSDELSLFLELLYNSTILKDKISENFENVIFNVGNLKIKYFTTLDRIRIFDKRKLEHNKEMFKYIRSSPKLKNKLYNKLLIDMMLNILC